MNLTSPIDPAGRELSGAKGVKPTKSSILIDFAAIAVAAAAAAAAAVFFCNFQNWKNIGKERNFIFFLIQISDSAFLILNLGDFSENFQSQQQQSLHCLELGPGSGWLQGHFFCIINLIF